jgi:hypothetical protein
MSTHYEDSDADINDYNSFSDDDINDYNSVSNAAIIDSPDESLYSDNDDAGRRSPVGLLLDIFYMQPGSVHDFVLKLLHAS